MKSTTRNRATTDDRFSQGADDGGDRNSKGCQAQVSRTLLQEGRRPHSPNCQIVNDSYMYGQPPAQNVAFWGLAAPGCAELLQQQRLGDQEGEAGALVYDGAYAVYIRKPAATQELEAEEHKAKAARDGIHHIRGLSKNRPTSSYELPSAAAAPKGMIGGEGQLHEMLPVAVAGQKGAAGEWRNAMSLSWHKLGWHAESPNSNSSPPAPLVFAADGVDVHCPEAPGSQFAPERQGTYLKQPYRGVLAVRSAACLSVGTGANLLRPVRHAAIQVWSPPSIILRTAVARAEPPQACRIRPGTVRNVPRHLFLAAARLHRRPTRLVLEAAWPLLPFGGGRAWGWGTEPESCPCRVVESSRTPGSAAVTTVIVPGQPTGDQCLIQDAVHGNSGPARARPDERELTAATTR
ncbi:hypothetical protein TARUN_5545 [Trichoderma arundinaceum]|uniref:Uncharacterized protein n=1 Tax=Trichoderma arundinaceum TaxID=490622 RepID=A0A395NKY4_TRIAR|nr:hypothetical protein TARUN_5545 [Trichoderma arundinaceum]